MTPDEYKQKLARAEALCALDPEPNTPDGRELMDLAVVLQEYERAAFPMMVTKVDIAMLRGGMPDTCDFCGQATPPEQLEPEEAGDWVCWHCLFRWAKEDDNLQEQAFWERALKEYACRHTP